MPTSIEYFDSTFSFEDSFYISPNKVNPAILNYLLTDNLSDGLPIAFSTINKKTQILFTTNNEVSFEDYILIISPNAIQIEASSQNGFFYGIQSLKQIFLTARLKPINGRVYLPCLKIIDGPRFKYRGMHLDVSRHYFSIEFVKNYIDFLAYHKLNYFHWHLTDDQGWRIEIKKYPLLTQIGSKRNETLSGHASDPTLKFDNTPYGGYYTQDEIREIVAYAKARYVTIIPEIEMPGHALAALASYPELSCTKEVLEVGTTWGVFDDVYCTKEEVFVFLEGILDEVMDLFPGPYIHIGGDESPKTRWKLCDACQSVLKKQGLENEEALQSYFIQRIEKYVNANGKSIIGWDEILEGGLAPNATVMSWRGISGGIEAAESGHDVIMTPTSHCYFDYYQSISDKEPLAIGGFTPLKKVYGFEPIPTSLSPEARDHILGAQANVWTEYIPTSEHCEYMIFPRLCAIAEVNWSEKNNKSWDDFVDRLTSHFERLDYLGIHYANHLDDVIMEHNFTASGEITVELNIESDEYQIFYSKNKGPFTTSFLQYDGTLMLDSSTQLSYFSYNPKTQIASDTSSVRFMKHTGFGKDINITPAPDKLYPGSLGNRTILDGFRGSKRFNGSSYLGFFGKDVEIIIDLKKEQVINELLLGSLEAEASWIYVPDSLKLECSSDGQKFSRLSNLSSSSFDSKNRQFKFAFESTNCRYIKLNLYPQNPIPAGHSGAGNPSWIFIDEIIVE